MKGEFVEAFITKLLQVYFHRWDFTCVELKMKTWLFQLLSDAFQVIQYDFKILFFGFEINHDWAFEFAILRVNINLFNFKCDKPLPWETLQHAFIFKLTISKNTQCFHYVFKVRFKLAFIDFNKWLFSLLRDYLLWIFLNFQNRISNFFTLSSWVWISDISLTVCDNYKRNRTFSILNILYEPDCKSVIYVWKLTISQKRHIDFIK